LTQIVDISGLAEVLLCSEHILRKTWREYPHFFIGLGGTARGARFDVNDVIRYLKERDYADLGQKNKNLDRECSTKRVPQKGKKRVQNKVGSERVGKADMGRVAGAQKDRFNLCAGL